MIDDLTPENFAKFQRRINPAESETGTENEGAEYQKDRPKQELLKDTQLECIKCGGTMEKSILAAAKTRNIVLLAIGSILILVIGVVSFVTKNPLVSFVLLILIFIGNLIGDGSREGWKCQTCGHVLEIS